MKTKVRKEFAVCGIVAEFTSADIFVIDEIHRQVKSHLEYMFQRSQDDPNDKTASDAVRPLQILDRLLTRIVGDASFRSNLLEDEPEEENKNENE